MATVAEFAAVIERNDSVYRKIAEQQSLALSRVADLQLAGVGEALRRR